METRRNIRAGVLVWTSAPVQNSSSSSLTEDEEDFVSQMDEDGIIGLSEALEEVELEAAASCEELKSNLREVGLKASMENETVGLRNVKRRSENLTEEEEDQKESDRRTKHELCSTSGELGATNDVASRAHRPNGEAAESSGCLCPGLQSASPVKASFLPHLLHFTPEELAAAPGIEAETLPDISESLSESPHNPTSSRSSPRSPDLMLSAPPQPGPSFYEQFSSDHLNALGNGPTELPPSPVKMRTHSPEASRTNFCTRVETDPSESKQQNKSHNRKSKIPTRTGDDAAEVDLFRKGPVSHQTPDFSRVEPRVQFPKAGYKPPTSKRSLTPTSMSPGPPIVFKSPADIVKEVLFRSSSGSSSPSGSVRTPTGAANFTVPPEFRCRQQATTLLQQLQEDYKKLLTKYAEAENTIDRLRLEAKVNLYSDPPKTGQASHSGLNLNASTFLRLDLSQAQRAEAGSARLYPDTHASRRENSAARLSSPHPGRQLTAILFSRTHKFLQQLQTFEDLLTSEKLTAFEKTEGLSRLSEGLNSLERGYLLARDEHKVLQQRGVESCGFDPERELEGLIFQCGLHMEELKEQQICDPCPEAQSTSSSEEENTLTHPQSPPESETSSKKSGDEEEAEDEETLQSLHHRPLISNHTHVESNWTEPEEEELKVLKTSSQRKDESDQDSPVHTRKPWCSRVSLSSCSRRRSAMRRAPSSSLSSLTDITSKTRSSRGQTGSQREPPQDRIISPETDSGFVGSESSRQTPAAAAGLLHQRASESVPVPQDVNSRQPPPSFSPSRGHTAQEPAVSSQLDPNHPRRTRAGQRRRTSSCSPQLCVSQRGPWPETATGSEVEEGDRYAHSIDSPYTSHSGCPSAARYRHGDSLRPPSSRQGGNYNDAVWTEAARLKEEVENYLRNKTPSAQRSCSHQDDSSAPVRSVNVLSGDSLGRRETFERDSALRRRSASAQRKQQDVLWRSEVEAPTPQGQPQVSRFTQTSAAPQSCSSASGHSRKTHSSADEADSRDQGRVCHQCLKRVRDHRAERPPGGTRGSSPSSFSPCSVCGCLKAHKHSETAFHKQNPSAHQNCRPAESPDRAASRRYCTASASPPLLQFIPVSPPQLLLYSAPLHVSPDNINVVSSGFRLPERRGRIRRPVCDDRRRSLDGSLNRAIRAARHMKHTSRHMARSLAAGLQHQQSCSY